MSWISVAELCRQLDDAPWKAPRYQDLAERIALLVSDGRIAPGSRLPSERDLAAGIGLSRTTVSAAFAQLVERGLLEPKRGAGHFVPARGLPSVSALLPPPGSDPEGRIILTVAGDVAPPCVPAAFRRAGERMGELLGGIGYFPDGLPELRERIAQRYTDRGLPTTPDQILVTSGALSGLQICAAATARPRSLLVAESVGYGNALRMLQHEAQRSGMRLRSFDVSPQGWNLDALESVLRQGRAASIFLTPDFHNPTGRQMDDPERAEVAGLAAAHGATLVADETLVDLGMPWARTTLPLAAHSDEALLVGSASKMFWGGLRIGWIRASVTMMPALLDTRTIADHGAAAFEQLVLCELLDDPSAVTETRDRLRERLPEAMSIVARRLPSFVLRRPDGGHSLWLELPEECSTRLCAQAAEHGLILAPGPHFFCHPGGERWLRLPVVVDAGTFDEAMRRLALAWEDLEAGVRPRARRGAPVMSA